MEITAEHSDGLRVLCLDGPPFPAAALSEPLFLQQIAHRWAYKEGDENSIEGDAVRVSDMFDVIGGSGIGGLYAILFARLNMTVGQVIEFHILLVNNLFMADCWTRKDQNDCTLALDRILNQLVGIKVDLDSRFFSKDCKKCFIAVLNETKENTALPRALRTYKVRTHSSPNCTIRQALHATLADLEHFPAVSIGDELFIDASSAFPNVSRLLVKELASAFPELGLACLVNLGADNTHPTNNSHMVGQDLTSQFKDLRCFFRLSVREQLQAESRIKSLVMGCFQEEDISIMADEIIDAIKGREQLVKMQRLGNLAGEDGRSELYRKVTHICNEGEIKRALEKIHAPDTFRPTREDGCLPGTREDILEPIRAWVEKVDDDTPNVFCLDGYPGTGKTAICITLKQRLAEAGFLGASCFFRREDASQHGLSAFFRSIASQLLKKPGSIRNKIVQVANSDAFNIESAPSIVFEKLIWGPLAESGESNSPIVLVLDALDEFGKSDTERQNLIKLLLPKWIQLPCRCKLFIASRSQGDLPQYLNVPGHAVQRLEVGDSTSIETRSDIRRFFKHSFEEIRGTCGISPAFVSSSDFDELVGASAGLFIWAHTVVEIVRQMRTNVRQVLHDLRDRQTTIGEIEMDPLHRLYSSILQPLLKGNRFIISILSAVISARTPLSATALSPLCKLDVYDIEDTVRQLGPVMDTTNGLRFVHKSFVDYVLSRYLPVQLPINETEFMLAASCFEIMDDQLHFNMGNIPSSYMLNSEVPDLHRGLSEELQYASRFWGAHLKECKDKAKTLAQPINNFLNHWFLYWVEAVSIIGCFREAMKSLLNLRVAQLDKAMSDFAQDALAFLRQFSQPISQSYPHIYISAIPWTPTTSLIRRKYLNSVCHVLNITSNGDESWPVQLAVIQGHTSSVWSVAFSPDGSQIVSGSSDRTIRIWDTATRQPVGEPFRGHTDSIRSVAFSPDGSQIVSGSRDNTIRIWDADTRQPVGQPLRGHTDSVWSVTFSPDGSQIASGSKDNTVCIWDAGTLQPVGEPLRGHTSSINSIAFSPDGSQIVSGSEDNTVRIWGATTRQPVGEPLRGHTSSVWSVAFSPDGSQIVSGSHDRTVRIWDAAILQPVGDPLRGHTDSVWSVTFSPDGSQIASGSKDNTVRIWDGATRQPVGEPLRGHTFWVNSVACSPDGSQIVSGSYDETVRIWDAAIHQPAGEPLRGHADSVRSVAFSPDGSQIVSGSRDKTVRIWDAATRQPVGKPLRGHTSVVWPVAFSPDGSQIVSGSDDTTVRIWDAATRQPVGQPLRHHISSVRSVAFSPDGSQIVSGSEDNTVCIWDAATRQPVGKPLRGHTGSVESVAFSPDGYQIVSGSRDMTVRIWDAATCQPVGEPLRFLTTLSLPRPSHSLPLPCFLLHDGWVIDQHTCRLVWVPQHFHGFLPTPSLVEIIGSRRMVVIDASHLRTGTQWTACINTNSM